MPETLGREEVKTYVQDNNKQEIHVGDVMELEPDVLRDEGERGVLGGTDLVSRIVIIGETLLISFSFGNRDVEINSTVNAAVIIVVVTSPRTRGPRFVLLILRIGMPVETVHDRDPFSRPPGTVDARCGPSLTFGRLRDLTAQLAVLVAGLLVPCAELYGRHLGGSKPSRGHENSEEKKGQI